MKYTPKLPEENINISGAQGWKSILGLIVVGVGVIVLIFTTIYLLADSLVVHVPISYENNFKKVFRNQVPSNYNIEASQMLQKKIEEIIEKSKLYPFEFEVNVIDSKVKNAGILPGGIIVFNSELIKSFKSENELIFVLAHELGHFYNRHHLKSIGTALGVTLLMTIFSSQLDIFNDVVSTSGTYTLNSFSRSNELESDKFALRLLSDYYGHVKGHDQFFKMIREENGRSEEVLQFIQTHPSSTRRIKQLQELVEKNNYKTEGELSPIAPYLELVNSDK